MIPIKQKQNRVWRSYTGGLPLNRWQGNAEADGDTPEEWVGSTVPARGKNRPANEGLSVMLTPDDEGLLKDLIAANPEEYLGKRIAEEYGDTALLVKLLDSKERLTVQVHPTRADAEKYFNSRFGKTEGWYILETREVDGEQAYVYLGFKEGVTAEEWGKYFFEQNIEAMLNCLHKVYVKPGDCFIVEGGTPHAIGSGCFLLEIQEPTDYTLRVEKITPQGVELDEAGRVAVVVGDGAFLEGYEVLVVKRVRALAADHRDITLVKLEPHLAADEFLAAVNGSLEHCALRGEPEAVIDKLGIFRHQLVLEMHGTAVERD